MNKKELPVGSSFLLSHLQFLNSSFLLFRYATLMISITSVIAIFVYMLLKSFSLIVPIVTALSSAFLTSTI